MELWRLKFLSIFFAAAFMLVVAIRLNIDQMYLMAGILVSIPLVSFIIGNLALKRVEVYRVGPDTCFEGDMVRIEMTLSGPNELMRNLLTVRDATPEGLSVHRVTPDLDSPGRMTEELFASRRGHYKLDSGRLSASDPLGLFVFHRTIPLDAEMLVYPIPLELPEALLGREARSGREVRTSLTRRGESPEMHSTREYRPGDELRHIHWPSTARTGRLVVMEREEPSDPGTWIALDLQRGSELGAPPNSSLDVAVRLAAAAARDVLSDGEAVALLLPGVNVGTAAPSRGADYYYSLLNDLAVVRAVSDASLGSALIESSANARARLLFFTAVPDERLVQGLGVWIGQGGSATGVLIAEEENSPASDRVSDFAAAVEGMGAVLHRVALSSIEALSPHDDDDPEDWA